MLGHAVTPFQRCNTIIGSLAPPRISTPEDLIWHTYLYLVSQTRLFPVGGVDSFLWAVWPPRFQLATPPIGKHLTHETNPYQNLGVLVPPEGYHIGTLYACTREHEMMKIKLTRRMQGTVGYVAAT